MHGSQDPANNEHTNSDENDARVEYIPFKKRRIFVNNLKTRRNGSSGSYLKGGGQNVDFEPGSQGQEDQGEHRQEIQEECEEGKGKGDEEGAGGGGRVIPGRRILTDLAPKPAETDLIEKNEEEIINQVTSSIGFSLVPVRERAQGIVYERALDSIYTVPRRYAALDSGFLQRVRAVMKIEVSGSDVPPPIPKFEHMKLPKSIMRALAEKKIKTPTKIQMQGLPAVLLGRDIIGISSTGSGKTLVFVIPLVLFSLELELRLPIDRLEGPFGLVLCPSRELASQIQEIVDYFAKYLYRDGGPMLRTLCVIGGTGVNEQQRSLRNGVHMVVATPGRLNDLVTKKVLNLAQCRYLCFDEADRLIDLGFEEEITNVLNHFRNQRQTLLFSATMPRKIQEFAKLALVDPIVVSVGLSGSANRNVRQHVISVSKQLKLPTILDCLRKTGPPVMIFCENKPDVDVIHEYLLLKGVDAASIHGGLSQEERTRSIESFRALKKDVLIGTDVASKGLDFPSVQHVINFDLPREIENYIHRIGRTGRGEKQGLATTLLDGSEEESSLRNLKSILMESNQTIPPFLQNVQVDEDTLREIGGLKGCGLCGALGHRMADCPKHQNEAKRTRDEEDFDGF